MKTKIDKRKYPLIAYVDIKGEWVKFNCSLTKQRMITTDIGQHTVGSGYVIKTPSEIDFRVNYVINVAGEDLTVDSVDSEIDQSHGGRFRGKPRWIVRMEVS